MRLRAALTDSHLVVVTTRAVRMAVGQLIRAGCAHVYDFDVKSQLLACQWMIGVDIGSVTARFGHGYRVSSFLGIHLNHHARAQLALE